MTKMVLAASVTAALARHRRSDVNFQPAIYRAGTLPALPPRLSAVERCCSTRPSMRAAR